MGRKRASLSAAEREMERIEIRRKKLIEMVMNGVAPSEVRDEMNANAARREELKAKLAAVDEPPPFLHPEMARIYRAKAQSWRRQYRNRTAARRRPRRCAAS
jgi:site-specific DNA recombinase